MKELENSEAKTELGVITRVNPWTLFGLLLFVCLAVRLALAPIMMNDFDRKDYVSNAHKTLRYGVAQYYEPNPNYKGYGGVPSSYPPLQIYGYALAGRLYDRFFDPDFSEIVWWRNLPFDSLSLNYLIKAPIFLFELLLTGVIFIWLRDRVGDLKALLCAGLYGLNPAVLYDGTLWEQPDALHSTFLVLSIVFLVVKRPVVCLIMLALALCSKPQPSIFVPLIGLLVLTRCSLKQTVVAVLAAVATVSLVFLPYIVNGTRAVVQMLNIMQGANPVVSAQAHNFWWLVLAPFGQDPLKLPDRSPIFLGISYFALSMTIILIFYAAVSYRMLKSKTEPLPVEPFAYIGLLFFAFSVRGHENHAIQVLPLLLLTGLAFTYQRIIFAALSLTILVNMALHSPEIVGEQSSTVIDWIKVVNSGGCVGIFLYWTSKMGFRTSIASS
jgi:hypothetical protein